MLVNCTYARQYTCKKSRETKKFNNRTFTTFSTEDAYKLVNQWNKACGGWKYWVVDITTCHGIPEGEFLEEQGVKYQFAK